MSLARAFAVRQAPKQEAYLGYEILVAAEGPFRAKPDGLESLRTYHTTNVSIWLAGQMIREWDESPAMLFVSRDDAIEFGFEIGRMIVTQRYKSSAFNPLAHVRKLFKLPRLLFSN